MSDLSAEQLKKMGNKVVHAFSKAFDVFMEELKEDKVEDKTETPQAEKPKDDSTNTPSS